MSPDKIESGAPTAFELGRWTGHVEIMGHEIAGLKRSVDEKVGREEFNKAVRSLAWLNLTILAAIVGLAFMALKPNPSG